MKDINLNSISALTCSKGAPYVSFEPYRNMSFIRHGFSTRLGGISKGCFESMNIGFDRGDNEENVLENFRLLGESIGFNYKDVVLNDQWHTTNIRIATAKDRGKGVIRSKDYSEIDGQITNEKGVVLMAYGADCVPVFFVDKEKKVIGMCHAGWKGTVNRIAKVIVEKMNSEYKSEAENIICVIGPSICSDCYEVSADVADRFIDEFKYQNIKPDKEIVRRGKSEDKFQLDLWLANKTVLLDAGIKDENIYISGMCTKCHGDMFFSHRRDGTLRGSMAGFLELI